MSKGRGASNKDVDKGATKGRIENQVQIWATPNTHEDLNTYMRGNQTLQAQKVKTASRLGLQAPRSEINGKGSSRSGKTSPPRLNPRFVEYLMGFPLGWTEFALLETPSCLWLRRWRSLLFKGGY
jgi:DNA (cytosine-5)-methyltransferase 1